MSSTTADLPLEFVSSSVPTFVDGTRQMLDELWRCLLVFERAEGEVSRCLTTVALIYSKGAGASSRPDLASADSLLDWAVGNMWDSFVVEAARELGIDCGASGITGVDQDGAFAAAGLDDLESCKLRYKNEGRLADFPSAWALLEKRYSKQRVAHDAESRAEAAKRELAVRLVNSFGLYRDPPVKRRAGLEFTRYHRFDDILWYSWDTCDKTREILSDLGRFMELHGLSSRLGAVREQAEALHTEMRNASNTKRIPSAHWEFGDHLKARFYKHRIVFTLANPAVDEFYAFISTYGDLKSSNPS